MHCDVAFFFFVDGSVLKVLIQIFEATICAKRVRDNQ